MTISVCFMGSSVSEAHPEDVEPLQKEFRRGFLLSIHYRGKLDNS